MHLRVGQRSRIQAKEIGKRTHPKPAIRGDMPQTLQSPIEKRRVTRVSEKTNGKQNSAQAVVPDETESGEHELEEHPSPQTKLSGKGSSKKTVAQNRFRLGYLVHDVSRMRRTLVDQHMRPLGITRSQYWVLASLSRQGSTGTMSTELAKLLDVGKVTIGGLIDRLEISGYVYRRGDKEDRRAKRIYITETGYALIERMKSILVPLNDSLCVGLTEEAIALTERNLALIRSNIRKQLVDDEGVSEDPAEHIS